jgi:hypothetical protein
MSLFNHFLKLHVLHPVIKHGKLFSIVLNCRPNFNICFNIDKVLTSADRCVTLLKLQPLWLGVALLANFPKGSSYYRRFHEKS